MEHKCPSVRALVGLHMATHLELSAHTATYDGIACPVCKQRQYTTRLASDIHFYRHEMGWDIDTVRTEGLQANYIVRTVGEFPKVPAPVAEDQPRWRCLAFKVVNGKPGPAVKSAQAHGIRYPEQPDQRSTTDLTGRWAYGYCGSCNEYTLWQQEKS